MEASLGTIASRQTPWNRGRIVDQKPPMRLKDMWPFGPDQRVHLNPATLVTPNVRYAGVKLVHDQQREIGSD